LFDDFRLLYSIFRKLLDLKLLRRTASNDRLGSLARELVEPVVDFASKPGGQQRTF